MTELVGPPKVWRPYLTLALVLGLLAWQLYVSGGSGNATAPVLAQYGARKANLGFPQAPWRLMASVFLHYGWMHLVSNLVVIAAWGACLEKTLGRLEMLALFLLAGFWGSLASDLQGPNALGMGASGAGFAMITAVLVLALLGKEWSRWQGEAGRWLGVSVAAMALNALSAIGFANIIQGARLDHWAHGGGALCGLLLGLTAGLAGERRSRPVFWGTAAVLAGVAVAVVASRPANPFA